MRTYPLAALIVLVPAFAAIASGCGNAQYSSSLKSAKSNFTGTVVDDGSEDGSTGDGSETGDTGPRRTGVPQYRFKISGVGYTSQQVTVKANRILKMRFSPGWQDRPYQNTGYTFHYSMLGVFIDVAGQTQDTSLLYNGYPKSDSAGETSRVLDFSSAFTRKCAATDADCRQTITIVVKQPNSDAACLNWGQGCSYAHVPDGHSWNGTLIVETDDTDAF